MDDENTNAARLAEWLERGGAPPDDLDPDVLATVYALVPDRAPAPRVSLDDILGSVKDGPFGPASTPHEVSGFPKPARAGFTIHTGSAERPLPARKTPSPFWMAPAFGVVLAAAAAAALVFPVASKLGGLPRPDMTTAAPAPPPPLSAIAELTPEPRANSQAPSAPPPAGEAPGASMADAGRAKAPEEKAPDLELGADRVALGYVNGDGSAPRKAALAAGGVEREVAALEPLPSSTARMRGAGDGETAGYASASAPAQNALPAGPASAADKAPAPVVTASTATQPQSSPAPAEEQKDEQKADDASLTRARPSTSAGGRVIAEASPADEDDRYAEAEASPTAKKAEQTQSRRAPTRDTDASSTSARTDSPNAAAAGVLSARSEATPLDYTSQWYLGDVAVVALYQAPLAQEGAGEAATAAESWRALIGHARADVGQDAALHAGKLYRALGRTSDALLAVDAGLRRSSANTPIRAALYAFRGDLFSAVGKNPEAEAAWREAARLNMSR